MMFECAIGSCVKCSKKSYLFKTKIGVLCRICKVRIYGNCCTDQLPPSLHFATNVSEVHD